MAEEIAHGKAKRYKERSVGLQKETIGNREGQGSLNE